MSQARFTALVLAALVVAACAPPPSDKPEPLTSGQERYATGAGPVQVLTLEDGTRCAVFTGRYGQVGGIDCDWKQMSNEEGT